MGERNKNMNLMNIHDNIDGRQGVEEGRGLGRKGQCPEVKD